MKIKKFIIVALLILIVSAAFTACNTGGDLPSDGTVNIEITAEEESATQSESGTSQEETAPDSTSVYYVTEADDLEIMTAPANNSADITDSEDKGEDTPVTNAVAETQPEKDDNKQEETKIELPFIPAN